MHGLRLRRRATQWGPTRWPTGPIRGWWWKMSPRGPTWTTRGHFPMAARPRIGVQISAQGLLGPARASSSHGCQGHGFFPGPMRTKPSQTHMAGSGPTKAGVHDWRGQESYTWQDRDRIDWRKKTQYHREMPHIRLMRPTESLTSPIQLPSPGKATVAVTLNWPRICIKSLTNRLMRWPNEQCHDGLKGYLGMDHCEAGSRTSFHRHVPTNATAHIRHESSACS